MIGAQQPRDLSHQLWSFILLPMNTNMLLNHSENAADKMLWPPSQFIIFKLFSSSFSNKEQEEEEKKAKRSVAD